MSDQLTIRVSVDQNNNNTVSKFVVTENGQVTVFNDAGAALNVSFAGTSPLCEAGNPQLSIDIAAGANESYKICNGATGKSFKYTATVVGAGSEDPVIIVEQGKIGTVTAEEIAVPCPEPIYIFECDQGAIAAALAGFAVGVVATIAFILRKWSRQPPR